eukprot:gene37058-45712_t
MPSIDPNQLPSSTLRCSGFLRSSTTQPIFTQTAAPYTKPSQRPVRHLFPSRHPPCHALILLWRVVWHFKCRVFPAAKRESINYFILTEIPNSVPSLLQSKRMTLLWWFRTPHHRDAFRGSVCVFLSCSLESPLPVRLLLQLLLSSVTPFQCQPSHRTLSTKHIDSSYGIIFRRAKY